MITDDTVEIHFVLRLAYFARAANHAYAQIHFIPESLALDPTFGIHTYKT